MSGALKKRLGIDVVSDKDTTGGERRYHAAAIKPWLRRTYPGGRAQRPLVLWLQARVRPRKSCEAPHDATDPSLSRPHQPPLVWVLSRGYNNVTATNAMAKPGPVYSASKRTGTVPLGERSPRFGRVIRHSAEGMKGAARCRLTIPYRAAVGRRPAYMREGYMASSLKFGTSGLRGLAVDLTGVNSGRYAAAFLRYLRSRSDVTEVLIGRDLRASSPEISRSVIAALDASVVDCGEVPTPALALEALRRRAPAIMITGSHIPADRNGLKFYRADGEIDKDDEAGILAALDDAPTIGRPPVAESRINARYLERYARLLPTDALSGKRIGVWQHSTVSRDLFVDALRMFRATVVPLGRSDVFVPVDTEAVASDVVAELASWVAEHNLDALISADGDADRPLLVDDTGAIVRGDVIGMLTAKFLEARTVVTPVTSNSSIETTGHFPNVVRTRVGSPYVIAGMGNAPGPVVGFEANGGVLLGSDVGTNGATITALPTRDALLPILSVLGAAQANRQTLSQLVGTLPPRVSRSDRLEHVSAERTAILLARLQDDAAAYFGPQDTIKSLSSIDGLRYVLTSGDVVHYRPSGNAPELRCYTEASTAQRADELLAWGLKAAEAVVR